MVQALLDARKAFICSNHAEKRSAVSNHIGRSCRSSVEKRLEVNDLGKFILQRDTKLLAYFRTINGGTLYFDV